MLPYRTKPQNVEAIQFTGDRKNVDDILAWAMEPRGDYELREDARRTDRANIGEDSPLVVTHNLTINKWLGAPRDAISLWTGAWLVKNDEGFTVYPNEEFEKLFETR